jgi:hypothetical protein
MTKCNHEDIGRDAITHNGITHPTGEQKCLTCNKTLKQILEESREEGRKEHLMLLDEKMVKEMKGSSEWAELQAKMIKDAFERGKLEERKHLDTERALIYREAREDVKNEINNLISEEMNIANQQGQPTSRLTSLMVKMLELTSNK